VNLILPVHLNAQGAAVANLHAGLLFLIRNQPGISDNDRHILEQGLASELRDQTYKKWTMHLVSLYQEQLADRFKLIINGDVDQATADALNKLLAELGAPGIGYPPQPDPDALAKECRKLLDALRERCPGLIPPEPLKAGAVTAPIQVQPQEAATLIAVAARQAVLEAAGAPVPTDSKQLPQAVLWQEGADALLVEVGGIKINFGAGLISVAIPVRCEELPNTRGVVEVDLLFGTPDRPTGLLAAAAEPRGERAVVRRWGEALTALAWQAVLNSIGGVTAAAGVDRDGAPLIPTALTATPDGIGVLAQARHEMDRVRRGQVVLGSSDSGGRRP
jgi:hypothetical protein